VARTYSIISCDGHLEIPPDAWLRHVPPEHRDRAPRLIHLAGGGEGWIVEGMPIIHNGQNVSAGRPLKVLGQSYWNDDGTPVAGTGDAAQRLREQDFDGIDAEVLFPPVFISRYIANIADKDAYLAMVRAYNTFLAEDYCSVAPDRLIGNAVIPITGTDDAITEMKRVKSLGLRSICLAQFPAGDLTPSADDDVFWHAALEEGMAITAHGGLGDRMSPLMVASATGRFDIVTSLVSRTFPGPTAVIANMVVSGTFDRIPELRIYLAETNASWMPAVFYMMDDSYELFRDWYGVHLEMKPSEYAREHFRFGIVRDPLALKMRDLLPAEDLMWGTDFPHSVTSYPRTREWLEIIFDGVPVELRRKILLENPVEFFDLDATASLTETPSAA
jgi:predicted TIM-barrel fold metal-dependent hydrolase